MTRHPHSFLRRHFAGKPALVMKYQLFSQAKLLWDTVFCSLLEKISRLVQATKTTFVLYFKNLFTTFHVFFSDLFQFSITLSLALSFEKFETYPFISWFNAVKQTQLTTPSGLFKISSLFCKLYPFIVICSFNQTQLWFSAMTFRDPQLHSIILQAKKMK